MSAVVHLVRSYFWATPLSRGLVGLGLACIVVGMGGYLSMPGVSLWTAGAGAQWYQMTLLGLPWLGLMLLLAASVLMPAIVERLALGRAILVLPRGRACLLVSTIATAGLLALVTAVAAALAFADYPIAIDLERVFTRTLLMAFVDFGVLYTALWIVGKTSGVWRLMGSLLIIVGITLPLRYIGGIPPVTVIEWIGLAGWAAFGVGLVAGGRIARGIRLLHAWGRQLLDRLDPPVRYRPGTEAQLLLGTTRPWIVALGQLVPIVVAAGAFGLVQVWLYFLVICSAISGAITSYAAARSRRCWLRFDWSRAEIFGRVEAAYWRYNATALAALLALFVAVGTYLGVPAPVLGLGVPLLALGSVTSTYLGLMMTRGLGWFEACLAVATMLALGLTALAVAADDWAAAGRLELLLTALAIGFRLVARRRWARLDWMQCRADSRPRRAA